MVLRTLDLSRCGLSSPKTCSLLAGALRASLSLKEVPLVCTPGWCTGPPQLQDRTVEPPPLLLSPFSAPPVNPRPDFFFSRALWRSLYPQLDISHNPIGDGGAEAIAAVLRPAGDVRCLLERLNLRRCGIGPRGGSALCEATAGNEQLRSLNLTGNICMDDAAG